MIRGTDSVIRDRLDGRGQGVLLHIFPDDYPVGDPDPDLWALAGEPWHRADLRCLNGLRVVVRAWGKALAGEARIAGHACIDAGAKSVFAFATDELHCTPNESVVLAYDEDGDGTDAAD